MRGEKVEQSEIDYMRGAIDVARAIFAKPAESLESLETTARNEYLKHLQQESANTPSPYLD